MAYIGLGANLPSLAGAPDRTIEAAITDLGAAGRVRSRSSLYRTEPVGYEQQPPFVNAAALLETDLDPEALLDRLLAVERSYGRDRARGVANGPRTLDLDLLLVDDRVVQSPRLTLPHPELARRRFVLAPLAEIAPGLRHPVLGWTIRELLAELTDEGPNRRDAVHRMMSSQAEQR